jgi:hypothetical protein
MRVMDGSSADFIFDKDEMLSWLARSKRLGLSIGIISDLLGPGTFVTAVDDLLLGEEITITLRSYDATGRMLRTQKLKISDIIGVLPFNSTFKNPFYKATVFSSSQPG